MALTRKSLKAMGLTDEQVDSIIEMHTETVDGLKADVSKYKADAEKLPSVQRELDDLKAAGDGGYKEKYEKEHKAFEDFKTEQTAKETRTAKEKAFREVLKDAGLNDKGIDKAIKYAEWDKLELEADGKLKDANDHIKAVKEEWAEYVIKTQTGGAQTHNPPANNTGTVMTKKDIMSIKDYTERQNAIEQHPELFVNQTQKGN